MSPLATIAFGCGVNLQNKIKVNTYESPDGLAMACIHGTHHVDRRFASLTFIRIQLLNKSK